MSEKVSKRRQTCLVGMLAFYQYQDSTVKPNSCLNSPRSRQLSFLESSDLFQQRHSSLRFIQRTFAFARCVQTAEVWANFSRVEHALKGHRQHNMDGLCTKLSCDDVACCLLDTPI